MIALHALGFLSGVYVVIAMLIMCSSAVAYVLGGEKTKAEEARVERLIRRVQKHISVATAVCVISTLLALLAGGR